jgi:hypothetical protein
MIEVDEVRDLVRDYITADRRRGEDQPPAQADLPLRRTTAPAAARIPDADRGSLDVARSGIFLHVSRHRRQRVALQEGLDSAGETRLGAADAK